MQCRRLLLTDSNQEEKKVDYYLSYASMPRDIYEGSSPEFDKKAGLEFMHMNVERGMIQSLEKRLCLEEVKKVKRKWKR